MTNWRQSAEYKRAIAEAFAPYRDWKDDVRCVFCGIIVSKDRITPCHVFSVGAHPELKMEPLNIVPACSLDHDWYEKLTRAEKDAAVEEVLPGRIDELREMIRAKSSPLGVGKEQGRCR